MIKKYFSRLRQAGLNPHEIVGYIPKRELHFVIRDINNKRDKKSAHGKTPNRKIDIGTILECQACAKYILNSAIEKSLGHGIYD